MSVQPPEPQVEEYSGQIRRQVRPVGSTKNQSFSPGETQNQYVGLAFLLMIVTGLAIAALLVRLPVISGPFQSTAEAAFDILSHQRKEYFFFVGATYLSLLLLARKKWVAATFSFLLGLGWAVFHASVSAFLRSIGMDSFAEAQNFDYEEAKFWLETVGKVIEPSFKLETLFFYLFLSIPSFQFLKWLAVRNQVNDGAYRLGKLCISVSLMLAAVAMTVREAASFYVLNSESFSTTTSNFSHPVPALRATSERISLIVYIGESTSVMNMSLYGYPRQTNPRLGEIASTDANLVVFENVFSTHTHTSPSLLEALSFGIDPAEAFLPIDRRQRVSLVDLLGKGKVKPILLSNQGMVGTWNQTSSILFRSSDKVFSTDSRRFGNSDDRAAKPWDHVFFKTQLAAVEGASQETRSAIFLHSYAGHGGYHQNIPESFRQPVDTLLRQLEPTQITEKNSSRSIDGLEQYDAAIKYIDYSVSQTLDFVKQSARPLIFVYFSDHGDAVFSGKGHDSARFMHEMARVPLLIYFNEAAKTESPGVFEKYRHLASLRETSTLAQLPSTLLDLLGIEPDSSPEKAIQITPVIGEKMVHPPIIVRETSQGTTFVNLNSAPLTLPAGSPQRLIDNTDEATRTYTRTKNGSQNSAVCGAAGATSLEKMRRHALVSGCRFNAAD